MTFWKSQNCEDSEKISVHQGLGGREGGSTGHVQGSGAILCDIVTLETSHRTFRKLYNTQQEECALI